jgi:hypothetical protein
LLCLELLCTPDLEYGSPALPETITGTERAPKTEIQARRYNVVLCELQVHRRDFKIASLLIEISGVRLVAGCYLQARDTAAAPGLTDAG